MQPPWVAGSQRNRVLVIVMPQHGLLPFVMQPPWAAMSLHKREILTVTVILRLQMSWRAQGFESQDMGPFVPIILPHPRLRRTCEHKTQGTEQKERINGRMSSCHHSSVNPFGLTLLDFTRRKSSRRKDAWDVHPSFYLN